MSEAASRDSDDKGDTPQRPDRSTVMMLWTIAADTTWRMFVPVIGGTLLGVWADTSLTSKPLWTVIGMTAGVVIAGLLVRQQLQRK